MAFDYSTFNQSLNDLFNSNPNQSVANSASSLTGFSANDDISAFNSGNNAIGDMSGVSGNSTAGTQTGLANSTTGIGGVDDGTSMFTAKNVSQGVNAASGLANAWMGFENMQTAKDQLSFEKDSFNKNYAANVTTTNTALEDRQNARNATGDSRYQDTSSYMSDNQLS